MAWAPEGYGHDPIDVIQSICPGGAQEHHEPRLRESKSLLKLEALPPHLTVQQNILQT
jgi:hypothetical protein